MWKSCWPSAECKSTTSASSAGCSASPRILAEAARPCRHRVGDRWWVDETYVKVSGRWRYVYRAIDQFGQVIDVYVSPRRDGGAARCFFTRALAITKVVPVEVTTDKAAVYPHVLDELTPGAWHCTELYANNRMEADHGQLKPRLGPMRGLKTDHGARIILAGYAFIQNIRRGTTNSALTKQRPCGWRPPST